MLMYDPEPEPEFTQPRRELSIMDDPMWPKWFYVEVKTSGQPTRRYRQRRTSASARRLHRLCNAAWPETNGLVLSVDLIGGVVITITRPGYIEE